MAPGGNVRLFVEVNFDPSTLSADVVIPSAGTGAADVGYYVLVESDIAE